jgi:UDP-glucose 4-epimerase
MPRIGVTGATGFIGGALAPRLRARGHELVLVDNRTGPIRVEQPDLPAAHLDFGSDEAIQQLASCAAVIHLGAVSGVMACANDPTGTRAVNVEATRRLVHALGARGVPVAFASSLAVVGSPEAQPVTEATPARPTHEYARQKAEGEEIVRGIARDRGLGSAVLRMSNVYGSYDAEGRRVAKGNVLHLFAEQAVRDGRLTINAPGTQRRDFIHLDDVTAHWIAAAERLAAAPRGDPRTFNVASGTSLSVIELAHRVQETWFEVHPDRPPLKLDLVDNPRGGIELVDPTFSVSRRETESTLGVPCRHRLGADIAEELRAASGPVPP